MTAESRILRPVRVYPTAHGDLTFGRRCLIMGILNVTPDSFSDGGRFFDLVPLLSSSGEPEEIERTREAPRVPLLSSSGEPGEIERTREALSSRPGVEAGPRIPARGPARSTLTDQGHPARVPLAARCQCHPAVSRAEAMAVEGADVIDIGGESTRPGSRPVPDDEQIRRILPVIRELRVRGLPVPISVDTRSARVAAAALDAGADMVNDVSAAHHDADMPRLLAERRVPFVIMHIRGTPETMQIEPHYDDVVREVGEFFVERAEALSAAGVQVDGRMIVDPGIGFGKTVEHNLALVRAAATFGDKWPVMVGPSRKAFLGQLLNEPDPLKRLMGTASIVAHAALSGVDMVRVHDVKAMRQVIDVCFELSRTGHGRRPELRSKSAALDV